jgi:acetyl esterase/lipase
MDYDDAYAITKHVAAAPEIIAALPARSDAFRAALNGRYDLDLSYGPGARNIFDVYHPEGAAQGTMIFIHGGYWRILHSRPHGFLAAGALGRGWRAAMPSYDLCPSVHIRDITRQIAAAVTAIASRFDGPLAICGHSAGGHLAARMLDRALLSDEIAARIRHVMPIAPLTDLRPLMHTAMNDDFKLDDAEAMAESPVLMTDRHSVPVTVLVGADERPALIDQAHWLSDAWGCDLVIEPGKHHFDILDLLTDPDNPVVTRMLG